MKIGKQIEELIGKTQRKIDELYSKEPNNHIFEQEGILNGFQIVEEYLDVNENGLAVEHLLYMIYESEISFSAKHVEEANDLASKYKIKNLYFKL